MMKEVIRRRYSRLWSEKERLPDLILIDGGKGHLNAVKSELNKIMKHSRVPVISIAKAEELIYTENKSAPLKLARSSPALKLIMRIRDETHRFAISYHKLLRGKDLLRSALDEVEGVGEKRKKALINHFGSAGDVKKANLVQLKSVKGMDEKTAEKILQHFKKE